jgi:hypothetical protein
MGLQVQNCAAHDVDPAEFNWRERPVGCQRADIFVGARRRSATIAVLVPPVGHLGVSEVWFEGSFRSLFS